MQTVFSYVDNFYEKIGVIKLATLSGIMWLVYIILYVLLIIKVKPDNSKLISIFIAFLVLCLNIIMIELLMIFFGRLTYQHISEQITLKNKDSEYNYKTNQYQVQSDEIQNIYYQYQICPIIYVFISFGIRDLTASFGIQKLSSKTSFAMYFYYLFRQIILQPQQSYILVASIAGIVFLMISESQSWLNIVDQQDKPENNNSDIQIKKYAFCDISRGVIDQSQFNMLNNSKLNMSAQQRMQEDLEQNKSINQQQSFDQKSHSYQKEICTESIKQNILKIIPQGLVLVTQDYDLIYSNETIQNLLDASNSQLINIIQKISAFQTGETNEFKQKIRYEVSQQRSLGQIEGKNMDILQNSNAVGQDRPSSVESINSFYYDKIQNIRISVQNISNNLKNDSDLESSIKISSKKEQGQLQQNFDNTKDSKFKSKFYNMRNKQDLKTNSILTTKIPHQNNGSVLSQNDVFLNMEVQKISKQDRAKIQEATTLKEIMDYLLNESTFVDSSEHLKDNFKNDDNYDYDNMKNKSNKDSNSIEKNSNSFIFQIKNISHELINQARKTQNEIKQMSYQSSFDINQNIDQLQILKNAHENKFLSQKSCPMQNDSQFQNKSQYYFKSENLKTTSKEVNIICHHRETQKLIEIRLTKCKINLPNSSENFDQNEYESKQLSVPCILIMCEEISEKLYLTKMMRMAAYKSKMLASISHELRTPLNCSIGMLQLLLDRDDMSKDLLDFIVTPALYSNKLLLNIINDILDYNQINAGDFKLNFTRFNFKKVIEDCLMLVRYSCQLKNLNLTIKSEETLDNMEINSDPQRITQILLNLIQNAIKFTEEGGDITVLLTLYDTDLIQIDVSDTGCGIPLKKLRNLFNNFGKVRRDITTEKVIDDQGFGAGLGLTISNKLAKGVGCNREIKVATQLYKGSTFSFYVKNQTSKSFLYKKNTLKTFFSSVSDQTLYESSQQKSLQPPRASKQENQQIAHSPKQQMDEITSEKVLKSIKILDKKDFPFYHSKQIVENKSEERTWNGSNNLNTTSVVGFKLSESLHSSVQFEKEETSKYSGTHKSESFFYADIKEIQLLQQVDSKFKEKMLYYSRNMQCKNCSSILIVDDNEFNILTLRCLLNSYELRVDYALNGKLGYEMVQEKLKNQISITQLTEFFLGSKQGKSKSPTSLKKFEKSKAKEVVCSCNGYKLIFMDIDMPVMNGFQSAQKIIGLFKDYFTNVKKPFISTCSAFVTEQDQQKARESGMKFFLEKPISKIKLEFLLNKIFLNNINF